MTLQTLLEKFNYTCYYCHRKIGLNEATRDHFDPRLKPLALKKRGKKRPGGGKGDGENIVLACRWCNISKGNEVLNGFIKMKQIQSGRRK